MLVNLTVTVKEGITASHLVSVSVDDGLFESKLMSNETDLRGRGYTINEALADLGVQLNCFRYKDKPVFDFNGLKFG